jgi:hypothetical protein
VFYLFVQRIVTSEKAIKERTPSSERPFQEAIAAYEATIREKDVEIERIVDELKATRVAVSREQRLMASAYHNLGMQFQRSIGSMSGKGGSFLGGQRRGLEFHNN